MSKAGRAGVLVAVAVVLVAWLVAAVVRRPDRRDLLVAAAASLSGVAPELARAAHEAAGLDVRFAFGASNALARQIVEGVPVDVFISADAAQMDVVERAGRLVPGSRIDLLSNRLVVIIAAGAASAPAITGSRDLAADGIRRVAMGDPAAVPAGVYGRRWLESADVWSDVEMKVVPLPASPAVVAAVAEGRADAGIVYATDARSHESVRVAYEVPVDDAPPIVYPAAAVAGGREQAAREFLSFLQTPEAARVFAAAGFETVGRR